MTAEILPSIQSVREIDSRQRRGADLPCGRQTLRSSALETLPYRPRLRCGLPLPDHVRQACLLRLHTTPTRHLSSASRQRTRRRPETWTLVRLVRHQKYLGAPLETLSSCHTRPGSRRIEQANASTLRATSAGGQPQCREWGRLQPECPSRGAGRRAGLSWRS